MQKENMNHQLCFFTDLLFSKENIIEKLSERSSTPLADRPDMVFKDNKSLNTNYENFLKLLTMPPTYVEILGATGYIPGILNGHFCKYKPKEELVDAVEEAVEQVIELGDWVFLEEEGTEPNVELNEELLIVEEDKEPEDWLFVVKMKKEKHLKGGRDMEPGKEGGMWLGLKVKENEAVKNISFAALLNITGVKVPNSCGRGALVSDFLENGVNAEAYIKKLVEEAKQCNGFNFVALELSKNEANVYQHSNSPIINAHYIGKQTIGVGNSPVNTPLSKVSKGRLKFQKIVDKNLPKDQLVNELLQLLKDEESCVPDDELERRAPTAYKLLSSIYVKMENVYGTRAHSIILVDYDWNIEFVEHALEQPIDVSKSKWVESIIKSNL